MSETQSAIAVREFDPFQLMDALDDEAILAEIEGRISESWVYHFEQDGKEVWGLSKVGVDNACREMAKQGEAIREEDISWTVDPFDTQFALFKGFASRVILSKEGQEIVLDRAAGTKRQGLLVKRRDGKEAVNPFWFEQGSIKALRNARSRLLSEEVRAKIISKAKELGKVKKITPPLEPNWRPQFETVITTEQVKQDKDKKILLELLGSHGYETLSQIPTREIALTIHKEYLAKLKEVSYAPPA